MARHRIVVALDYGPTKNMDALALAARATFNSAMNYINYSAPRTYTFVYTNVERPDVGMCSKDGKRMRAAMLAAGLYVPAAHIFPTIGTSTVDEAARVRAKLCDVRIVPQHITVFCDRWHRWRVHMVWKHFFPRAKIEVISVPCMWDETSALWLQRSVWTWAAANIVGALAMRIFGVERVASFKQPI